MQIYNEPLRTATVISTAKTKPMPQITLESLKFIAYHGYYPEENQLGGSFELDLVVDYPLPLQGWEDQLEDTVNYEQLYTIAREEMQNTQKLIETVALNILKKIGKQWPNILEATVKIRKKSPIIQGTAQQSSFVLQWSELQQIKTQAL
jgi:7,8-dihydroneopterin aldolase/epimerase/oxygenase